MQSRPNTTFTPSVARTRSFQQRGNAPSIAFGGQAINNNNNAAVNAQNARGFATTGPSTQFATRGNGRALRAPGEVSRSWDRGRQHEWNHHHYRWSGGDWVIIDPGLPYDYGYGYGPDYYDEPAPYSSPAYSYDYSSSESLATSVQDRLTRLGYSPGPVDGVIGAQTRDALADFQNDNRLPVTGQIDTGTLRALGLQ
ncbi:MAG: peptidoglycan-binding domain-containing protein [Chthoniobacter sp.]|nr:peptidoglycan-binding domain-containing protein [Chthoniobacter sp.]